MTTVTYCIYHAVTYCTYHAVTYCTYHAVTYCTYHAVTYSITYLFASGSSNVNQKLVLQTKFVLLRSGPCRERRIRC